MGAMGLLSTFNALAISLCYSWEQLMGSKFAQTISSVGHRVSTWVADAAAHPITQIGVIAFCLVWWVLGLPTDILTATLSILAITLTQMVLNRQRLRDEKDRYRDTAMHAKLDELLRSEEHASKELAGIEELEAEELLALKRKLAQSRLASSTPREKSSADLRR